jgi:regulator of protease activity HflC (stomatin/prohibitin superfamily)
MLTLVLLASAAALGAAVGGITTSLPWVMTTLADRQVLVAFCEEGTVKSVTRGRAFSHQFMNWKSYHLNDPRKPWFDKEKPQWQILRHSDTDDSEYDDRPWFMKTPGVHWVGWPPFMKAYWYRFSWSEMRSVGNKGEEEVWHRNGNDGRGEPTDFVYAKAFSYVHVIKNVEIKDGFPVDLTYVVTVKIENAYRALFRGEDWLKLMFAAADREARDFAGARHFQELLSEKPDQKVKLPGDEPSSFSVPIVGLTKSLHDDGPDTDGCGLLERYGVRIVSADLTDFDPIGSEVLAANRNRYVQEQNAAGLRVVGEAEAAVIEMKGRKEADVIDFKGAATAKALKSRIDVLAGAGRIGELILKTDAMASTGPGKTVIWANSPFKDTDSDLVEMLDKLKITPQQLKALLIMADQHTERSAAA